MNFPPTRHFIVCLCLTSGSALFAADAKQAPTTSPKAEAHPATTVTPDPVLSLPKLQVTAQRIKKIDKDILRLEKQINREKKKIKSTELDKALNNRHLASAAAIFGGNSAEHISAVAASRVMLMEQERMVLEAMKRPATLEERDLMEAEAEQLRITRRNLDDAAKQR